MSDTANTRQAWCTVREASCICTLEEGHDPPHVCECIGQWWINDDGELEVYRLPLLPIGLAKP